MPSSRFPVLRGSDVQQSRVQDNVQGLLGPIAKALQGTPIMGAPSPAWIRPSLLNGFADFGGGYAKAAYHRDALGYVHVKGLVAHAVGTGGGTIVFVLPLSYRPSESRYFVLMGTGATFQAVEVSPNGNVATQLVVAAGGNATLEFSFLAEA